MEQSKVTFIDESHYRDYLKELLNGNYQYCFDYVRGLLAQSIDIKDLYINLFQKSLYEVGTLWEFNRISVTVEHISTSITESLMALTYPMLFASEKIGKSAVISCIANEFHQIGGKMVADIFELNGWNGYFLGANKPYTELIKMIDSKEPAIVGLSLSIYSNFNNLTNIIERLLKEYPSLKIVVGGQAFRYIKPEDIAQFQPNVEHIDSLLSLEQRIKEFENN